MARPRNRRMAFRLHWFLDSSAGAAVRAASFRDTVALAASNIMITGYWILAQALVRTRTSRLQCKAFPLRQRSSKTPVKGRRGCATRLISSRPDELLFLTQRARVSGSGNGNYTLDVDDDNWRGAQSQLGSVGAQPRERRLATASRVRCGCKRNQ